MLVDDGIEGEAVAPRSREVPDVDVVVARGLHLAPEQQGVLGRSGCLTGSVLLDRDLLNLEPQDDRPDETEREPRVAVDNVVGTEVLQVDALLVEEGKGFVHVFQAVNAHFSFGGSRLKSMSHVRKKILASICISFTSRSPERISSSLRSIFPSRRSV